MPKKWEQSWVTTDELAKWLKETILNEAEVSIPTSHASSVMKAIKEAGWQTDHWENVYTHNPHSSMTNIRCSRTAETKAMKAFAAAAEAADKVAESSARLKQMLGDKNTTKVYKGYKPGYKMQQLPVPAKPEPTFFELRKTFITDGGGIEAKERMLSKVTLRVDGNGEYHWDPDPAVKLWDPPTQYGDGLRLSKREYLEREGLLPARQHLAPSTWFLVILALFAATVAGLDFGSGHVNGVLPAFDAVGLVLCGWIYQKKVKARKK